MIAYITIILIIGCFVGYFALSLTAFIPLAIILLIDYIVFLGIKKLFKKGGLSIVFGVLLLFIIIIPTGYAGYKCFNGFKQIWLGKDEISFESENLYDEKITYKIRMSQYAKKQYIYIKEYHWDIDTQKNNLIADEKCFYKEGDIGQYVENKTYRPCYFEYTLSNEKGQYDGKTIRIGLKTEDNMPIQESRTISSSSSHLPGGTIDQIAKSENVYIMIR